MPGKKIKLRIRAKARGGRNSLDTEADLRRRAHEAEALATEKEEQILGHVASVQASADKLADVVENKVTIATIKLNSVAQRLNTSVVQSLNTDGLELRLLKLEELVDKHIAISLWQKIKAVCNHKIW